VKDGLRLLLIVGVMYLAAMGLILALFALQHVFLAGGA
jgi:hypothetical protein